MRHRVSIEIDSTSVGQAFAHTDDQAQADMINEMGFILKAICKDDYDMQICSLTKHLNKHGKYLIKDLTEFIKLGEDAE